MGLRARPSEDEVLVAWGYLKSDIERVECALPSQISAAVERLGQRKLAFEDLLLGRDAGRAALQSQLKDTGHG